MPRSPLDTPKFQVSCRDYRSIALPESAAQRLLQSLNHADSHCGLEHTLAPYDPERFVGSRFLEDDNA